ncbi:hypothetical protein THRCLA_08269 [Thraustotheca clavata]|uniref:Uncharacterized protein n=1 Tax=Thraustotheca clavata TaxID=74557 RepID=A0A1V9Z7Q6_9STRA|nr:hypothetical protein THRCLA_08269 [Thraustotheca clavata]
MVRKKKKSVNSLVKANGQANSPLPVDIKSIDVPELVVVVLSAKEDVVLELDLKSLHHNLLHSPDLYSQLKVLQLFRSHIKLAGAVSISDLSFETQRTHWIFASNALRYVFRLYMAQAMKATRKTLLPILDALVLFDTAYPTLKHLQLPSISDVLAQEMEIFVQSVVNTDVHATEAVLEVVEQLLAVVDFAHLTEMLWLMHSSGSNVLSYILKFCASQLRILSSPIVSYNCTNGNEDDETLQSSEVIHASERCIGLVKPIIVLSSVQQKSVLRTIHLSPSSSNGGSLLSIYEDMIEQCLVLLNTSVVQKDLLTQVGLACTLLLKLHHREVKRKDFVGDMLGWIFQKNNANLTVWLAKLDISTFTTMSKLALYRGLLNCLDDASFRLQYNVMRVIELVFSTTLAECVVAPTLSIRLYAFQVIEMFLRRTIALIQKGDRGLLTDATILTLLDVILLNWEHPAKRINQFMAPMFTHVITMLDAEGQQNRWPSILRRILDQPEENRAKYIALCILLPKVTVPVLFKEQPTFLNGVLAAVANQDVSASAACLIGLVVETLRQLYKDVNVWASKWVPSVVNVLLSSNAGLRLRIATYVLPIISKIDPLCVELLLTALRKEPESDTKLWSMLELVKCARKTCASPPSLTIDEVQVALVHADGDIRIAAYDMVCANLKTTALPSPTDLELVQHFFLLSSKSIAPSLRMKSIIGLKSMLLRIRDGMRGSCRRQGATTDATAPEFSKWLEDFVMTCIYPGATPQRLTMGLDIMQLFQQIFGSSSFHTPAITKALFNSLISSWDKIRDLSVAILDTFPSPLPGYDNRQSLESLLQWALTLSYSPRQRESDAGALFLRLLFKQSEHLVSFGIIPSGKSSQQAVVDYIISLLQSRLSLVVSKTSASDPPLIHGLLLACRYLLEDSKLEFPAWQSTIETLFTCLWQSMQVALNVVGDATSGVGTSSLDDGFSVVGEVMSSSELQAKVDCRGHLILEDADPDTEQRAVVGSWLAAREAGAAMETLVRLTLPIAPQDSSILTSLHKSGECLLNSLFELKHGGAVATVSIAFEGVCKSLLHHSENHRALGQWPARWSETLLHRLEHAEQHFILRRSAGFASSFVSILRAEPRNAAATMLPTVLLTLLRLSGKDNSVDRSRVHALNILKLVAQDGVLADDVAAYVPSMLRVAIDGFQSTSWAVRNSSMMLFAATTQRGIGDKQVADGASSVGVSSKDVFTRCAGVDTFLVQHIQAGSEAATSTSLYPLLLFLSRLRPGDDMAGVLPLSTFVPFVLACAKQSNIFHRRIAAHALAAIVRSNDIAAVVEALLQTLHSLLPRRVQHNTMHGTLLQLLALLPRLDEDTEKKMLSKDMRRQILNRVCSTLSQLFPFALQLKCHTNKGTFFQVASAAVFAGDSTGTLTACMLRSAVSIFRAPPTMHRSPGLNIVYQAVAAFLVKHALANPTTHGHFIVEGVRSPVFEIRRTTTTVCLDNHTNMQNIDGVFPALITQIVVESHPPTLGRQLQLIVSLAESSVKENWSTIAPAVPTLIDLSLNAVDSASKAAALQVLALLYRNAAPTVVPANLLSTLVAQIEILSDDLQPLIVRLSAAKSIGYSGVLSIEKIGKSNVQLGIQAWLSALVLLQDDDNQVRDIIRAATSSVLKDKHITSHPEPSYMMILPFAVEYLASTYGNEPYLQNAVVNYLIKWSDVETLLGQCIGASNDSATTSLLCEKIFEAESGNYFKEPDLLVQLYVQNFVDCGIVKLPSLVQSMDSCLKIWCDSQGTQAWVGGTTYFPDIFPLLHNLILINCGQLSGDDSHELSSAIAAKSQVLLAAESSNMHPLLLKALNALVHACDPATNSINLKPLLYLTAYWESPHRIRSG